MTGAIGMVTAAELAIIGEILPFAALSEQEDCFDLAHAVALAVGSLDLDQLRRRALVELIIGIETLPDSGPKVAELPYILQGRFPAFLPETWDQIARLTLGEMLSWKAIGVTKVRSFIDFVVGRLLATTERVARVVSSPSATPSALDASDDPVSALRRIAAWGAAKGHSSMFDALLDAATGTQDVPLRALRDLEMLDLARFAGPDLIARWDPVQAATRLLDNLDERRREIAVARLLVPGRPKKTLDELGRELNITRERVRQIQTRLEQDIRTWLDTDEFRVVNRKVRELREQIGVACPIAEAPFEVQPDDDHLLDELFLWLAGPYVLDGAWLVLSERRTVDEIVRQAFDEAQQGNVAERNAVEDALFAAGIDALWVEGMVDSVDWLDTRDDRLIDWPRAAGKRAELVLEMTGRPMEWREIYEYGPHLAAENSFHNALATHPSLVRIGKTRYGLAKWGHEEYQGVVTEMRKVLEAFDEPVPLDDLAADLSERFGISKNSVSMNAMRHPMFVMEAGWVRLRRASEIYQPEGSLREATDCFVVGGAWALRVPVDGDVVRGSGRQIPEHFALHLGVQPMQRGTLKGPVRGIHVGWGQYPAFGSIRLNVANLGLEIGDVVFVRRVTPRRLDFVGVPRADYEVADPEVRLRRLIGADASDDRPWATVLGEALDFGGAASPPIHNLIHVLEQKKQDDVLDCVRSLVSGEAHG